MNEHQHDAEQWRLVPHFFNLYELSNFGRLRKVKTGRIIKLNQSSFSVQIGKKVLCCSRRRLLKKIWGITTGRGSSGTPVSIVIEKDGDSMRFGTIVAASDFLSQSVFCSSHTIEKKLWTREPVIYDFNITYIERCLS